MDIRCRCAACQTRFKVAEKYAGKRARCPKCQQIVEVPLTGSDDSNIVATAASSEPLAARSAAGGSSTRLPPLPAAAAPAALPAPPAPSAPLPATPASGGMPIIQINTAPAKGGSGAMTAAASAGTAPHSRTRKSNPLPLIVGGGAAACVLVVGFIVAAIVLSRPIDPSPSPKMSAAASSAPRTALVLDWPPDQRSGGGMLVDGLSRPVSARGDIRLDLDPGTHRVLLQRRGYEPIELVVTLSDGQTETISPQWKALEVAAGVAQAAPSSPSSSVPAFSSDSRFPIGTAVQSLAPRGFDGWLQHFDLAQRQAQEENKDILLVFGCSDAQPATQQLARMLSDGPLKALVEQTVRVVVDFPRTQEGYERLEDLAENRRLSQLFGITELPALVLADSAGRPYFLEEDWEALEQAPAQFLEWQKGRAERDALLAAAAEGSDEEQLAAAVKALQWLDDKHLLRFFADEIGQWGTMAARLDPNNEQSLLETFFEPQWFIRAVGLDGDRPEAAVALVRDLDPWIERPFRDHDRGVRLHLLAAFYLAQVQQLEHAQKHLEHAVRYQPKDPTLAGRVQHVKSLLQQKDLIKTGTAFLISAAGYALTNRHVIDGPGRVEIRVPGLDGDVSAEVIARSEHQDIALLKFDVPPAAKLPVLPLAIGANVGRGTAVAAFGYPLITQLGTGVKLTDGIINGLPQESPHGMYLLSAKIDSGNSGGPLCDTAGNVVGMNTAVVGALESFGMAIPSADLAAFLDQHLPADVPRATPSTATDVAPNWARIDRQFSGGVLLVLKKR